ncbi:MAG: cupredoxin domain-containing protein [Acidimicrobiales bacterium]
MPRLRTAAALLALVAVLALAHVGPAMAATVNVTVADNVFEPQAASAVAGDSVVWAQPGSRVHTVTADDGSFDSGNLAAGQTFSRTFNTPGTIRYYCKIHGAPGGIGMSGVITVTAAQVTTTTAATTTTTAATTTTTAGTTTTTTTVPATTTTVAAAADSATTTTAPPQVLAAGAGNEQQPAALASTGLEVGYLAALGLALVLTGFAVVSEARRH